MFMSCCFSEIFFEFRRIRLSFKNKTGNCYIITNSLFSSSNVQQPEIQKALKSECITPILPPFLWIPVWISESGLSFYWVLFNHKWIWVYLLIIAILCAVYSYTCNFVLPSVFVLCFKSILPSQIKCIVIINNMIINNITINISSSYSFVAAKVNVISLIVAEIKGEELSQGDFTGVPRGFALKRCLQLPGFE